ncbi:MAG: hypothetical protein Q4E89_10975 [Eubacteriales bacterium]|nr:hypothetical protein [Eubacteriales bacterium]
MFICYVPGGGCCARRFRALDMQVPDSFLSGWAAERVDFGRIRE